MVLLCFHFISPCFPDKLLSGKNYPGHFLMMPYMCVFIFKAVEEDDGNPAKHVTVTEANDAPDPQV